ncbi:MAG: hypothetical protein LBT67_02820, partial [Holosporaceae bacterium]|nr:hypothetical protein [Holosporaceae bacterium]
MNDEIDGIVTVTKTISESPHDFSMLTLFYQASFTVKGVVIILILCSFWSWTIIFAKLSLLKKIKRKADEFEASFWKSSAIDTFFSEISEKSGDHPFLNVFAAGMKEVQRVKNRKTSLISNISSRVETAMRIALGREIDF